MTGYLLGACYMALGLVVVAEALNKLERADLFDGKRGLMPRLGGLGWLMTPWRWKRRRAVQVMEACYWALLAIGGAGAMASPFFDVRALSLRGAALLAGVALLIICNRFKETLPCATPSPESPSSWPPLA